MSKGFRNRVLVYDPRKGGNYFLMPNGSEICRGTEFTSTRGNRCVVDTIFNDWTIAWYEYFPQGRFYVVEDWSVKSQLTTTDGIW